MKLNGGKPYHYMKQHFFPKLRNAGYIKVFYEAQPDPELLSLNKAIDLLQAEQYAQALDKARQVFRSGTGSGRIERQDRKTE